MEAASSDSRSPKQKVRTGSFSHHAACGDLIKIYHRLSQEKHQGTLARSHAFVAKKLG